MSRPCTVFAERAVGGGGPTRRPLRRPPSFPVAMRAACASGGGGGCRWGGGRPQAMGRMVTPPPLVAGDAAAADVCGRVGGVGAAASQTGGDALCLQGTGGVPKDSHNVQFCAPPQRHQFDYQGLQRDFPGTCKKNNSALSSSVLSET